MITVQMTEVEYKAYQLYMKSIKVMLKEGKNISRKSSLDEYLADSENSKELEAGLEDVKAGRITYIDPENLWENIK
ncbi:MAG: hypothetical protein Q7U86_07780 [Draconibacterium sp.]|nr:hypothetical protein [Draconibacterium sp.]